MSSLFVGEMVELSGWELTGLILAVGVIALIVFYLLEEYIVDRVAGFFNVDIGLLPELVKFPLIVTVGLIVLFAAVQPLELTDAYIGIVGNTFVTIGTAVWLYGLVRIGNEVVETVIADRVDESLGPIAENVWDICIVVGSIGIVFTAWGVNITPILASAGVIGIILGFAARDTIANLFGSIALYVDKTYEKGDFIAIDGDSRGYVSDISIRSTEIRTLDGDTVALPNSELNNAVIRNKSKPQPAHRVSTSIGVSYGTDPEQVKSILYDIIENVKMANDNPTPQVHLRDFGDSSIVFEILVWIDDPSKKIHVEDDLNDRIQTRFEQEGITIPFPQRDIAITDHRD